MRENAVVPGGSLTERFTLATGELVWAVRVGDGDPAAAARLAASLPAPRKPMGARRSA